MHYDRLTIANIKKLNRDFDLQPACLVNGPNKSGKTGFLEAFRLAVTGKADIGGTNAKISKLVSGGAGFAVATADGKSSTWRVKNGPSVSCQHETDVDGQGGMPVSVTDFWALTSSDRMALVGGREALAKNAEEGLQVKALVKEQDAILSRPAPKAPDPYDGPSMSELEEKMGQVSMLLSKHQTCVKEQDSRQKQEKAAKQMLQTAQGIVTASRESEKEAAKRIEDANSKLESLKPILSLYEASTKNLPAEVSRFSHISKMAEAYHEGLKWLSENLDADTVWLVEASDAMAALAKNEAVDNFIGADPLLGDPAKRRDAELATIEAANKSIERAKRERERAEGQVREAEQSLAATQAIHGEPLSDEAHEKAVLELDELKEHHRQCQEWSSFNKRTGDYAVERSQAAMKIAELEEWLDRLRDDRRKLIESLKGKVGDVANKMLADGGFAPLEIRVASTPKTISLEVSVDGVAIEALASSERLVYGLCLLIAIQQQSDATCPILLAECGEMDSPMLAKMIQCIPDGIRGNIMLEHYLLPTDLGNVSLIDLTPKEALAC